MSKTKHEFELGDKVVYTHILKREGRHWVEVELPEPQEGIIIGARHKENSPIHGKDVRFKVFMIAQQLFKGSKLVLPIHITKIEPIDECCDDSDIPDDYIDGYWQEKSAKLDVLMAKIEALKNVMEKDEEDYGDE